MENYPKQQSPPADAAAGNTKEQRLKKSRSPDRNDDFQHRMGEIASRFDYIDQRMDELFRALEVLQSRLDDTIPAERWNNINRRIDEVFGVLQSLQATSTASSNASALAGPPSERGVFVVGHARSGTTVLADALNTSDDVCCLMEPYFYRSFDIPHFSESFNLMHRGFGNPPIKGYWIPEFGGETARSVVSHLRDTYRYVGEKLAFRQRENDYDPDKFLNFAVTYFAKSPFICVVRDPVKVTSSVLDMFENSAFDSSTIGAVAKSQLETYLLILRLAMTVPACYLLVHEYIDQDSFAALGSHLSINLERASSLYLPTFQRTPHSAEGEATLSADTRVQSLQGIYSDVQTIFDRAVLRVRDSQRANCRRLCEKITDLLREL